MFSVWVRRSLGNIFIRGVRGWGLMFWLYISERWEGGYEILL